MGKMNNLAIGTMEVLIASEIKEYLKGTFLDINEEILNALEDIITEYQSNHMREEAERTIIHVKKIVTQAVQLVYQECLSELNDKRGGLIDNVEALDE